MTKLFLFVILSLPVSAFALPDVGVGSATSRAGTQPRGVWAQFAITVVNKGDAIPATGVTNVKFDYAGVTTAQAYTGAIGVCDSVEIVSNPVFIPEANLNGPAKAYVTPMTGETNTSNNGPYNFTVSFPPLLAMKGMSK